MPDVPGSDGLIGHRKSAHLLIVRRDHLARFGFDGFGYFAQQHGCTVTVVNREDLSPQPELVEDPMAMVHAFSGRRPGLCACHRRIGKAAEGQAG